MSHRYRLRVHYEDTDASGVVYHANYLSFCSRARVEWLRDLGFSVGELQQSGYIFPVVSAELQYLSPAYLDDELEVHTQLVETKRVSLVFSQYVTRYNSNEILCKARIKVAYVDIHNMRPARLPEKLCQQ